jgi:transcription initiation factor TFIIB
MVIFISCGEYNNSKYFCQVSFGIMKSSYRNKMAKRWTPGYRCPECYGSNIIEDETTGEFICGECALVISDSMIDFSPERIAYTPKQYKQRCRSGPPIDYSHYDKGLFTSMDTIYRDAGGHLLPSKNRKRMWRLKKWDTRAKYYTSRNRNLSKAMTELNRLSEKLSIPTSVRTTAALFYRKALKKKLVQGRSIASLVAVALYVACRLTETPRSIKEIVHTSGRSRKEITRNYRLLVQHLGIRMPTHDPSKYLHKIGEKANVPTDVRRLASKILKAAKQQHITAGKNPQGIAAAAIYTAGKYLEKKITQKTIAKAANITEVTLRNRYHDLCKRLFEMEPVYLPRYQLNSLIN